MILFLGNMLYMLVRYASLIGPMCLTYLMLTLSGPVELLFLLCFIAAWTCVGECYICCMQLVCFLSMCLFVLCVLCWTVLVN